MKPIAIVLAGVILSGTAQAAPMVVDHFKCRITAVDGQNKALFGAMSDAYAVRKYSEAEIGGNKLTMSTGEMSLISVGSGNFASLKLIYQHAIRNDETGAPVEARQVFCMLLDTDMGQSPSAMPCLNTPVDPFDPERGWGVVPIQDGVPAFNPRGLRGVSLKYPDRSDAVVTFACDYLPPAN